MPNWWCKGARGGGALRGKLETSPPPSLTADIAFPPVSLGLPLNADNYGFCPQLQTETKVIKKYAESQNF